MCYYEGFIMPEAKETKNVIFDLFEDDIWGDSYIDEDKLKMISFYLMDGNFPVHKNDKGELVCHPYTCIFIPTSGNILLVRSDISSHINPDMTPLELPTQVLRKETLKKYASKAAADHRFTNYQTLYAQYCARQGELTELAIQIQK